MSGRYRNRQLLLAGGLVFAGVLVLSGPSADGFPRYNSEIGSCASCHGPFTGGFSPKGTVFPFGSNHGMHRASSEMNTDCSLCHHDDDGNNPLLNRSDSDGFGGGPGFGCNGCHGRDYGDLGVLAVGMREVHRRSGVHSCGASSCHRTDPDPLPEDVPPPVYGSYDTRAWDACNRAPFYGENFSLDDDNHDGLDNDGDGLYDQEDPDCVVVCPGDVTGDGIVDFADILVVLTEWGPCPGCDSDLDGDGEVTFADILVILSNWGPCD